MLLIALLQGCYGSCGGPFDPKPQCAEPAPLAAGTYFADPFVVDAAFPEADESPSGVLEVFEDGEMFLTFEDASGNVWEARYRLSGSVLDGGTR